MADVIHTSKRRQQRDEQGGSETENRVPKRQSDREGPGETPAGRQNQTVYKVKHKRLL